MLETPGSLEGTDVSRHVYDLAVGIGVGVTFVPGSWCDEGGIATVEKSHGQTQFSGGI